MKNLNFWQILGIILLVVAAIWYAYNHFHTPKPENPGQNPPPATAPTTNTTRPATTTSQPAPAPPGAR